MSMQFSAYINHEALKEKNIPSLAEAHELKLLGFCDNNKKTSG